MTTERSGRAARPGRGAAQRLAARCALRNRRTARPRVGATSGPTSSSRSLLRAGLGSTASRWPADQLAARRGAQPSHPPSTHTESRRPSPGTAIRGEPRPGTVGRHPASRRVAVGSAVAGRSTRDPARNCARARCEHLPTASAAATPRCSTSCSAGSPRCSAASTTPTPHRPLRHLRRHHLFCEPSPQLCEPWRAGALAALRARRPRRPRRHRGPVGTVHRGAAPATIERQNKSPPDLVEDVDRWVARAEQAACRQMVPRRLGHRTNCSATPTAADRRLQMTLTARQARRRRRGLITRRPAGAHDGRSFMTGQASSTAAQRRVNYRIAHGLRPPARGRHDDRLPPPPHPRPVRGGRVGANRHAVAAAGDRQFAAGASDRAAPQ